jgi:hypothetical protein
MRLRVGIDQRHRRRLAVEDLGDRGGRLLVADWARAVVWARAVTCSSPATTHFEQQQTTHEVFAERRRKVVAKLGGGVAVVFGASRGGGGISAVEAPFFQDPDFAWLTGISDEPGAILVMAPGERLFRETLLLPSRATRRPNAGTASACRSVPRSSAAPALRGCSGHRASARS